MAKYYAAELVQLLIHTGRRSPARAICLYDRTEDSEYDMTFAVGEFGQGRIRHRFMVIKGEAISRFYVERPGRVDIGEHAWVQLGMFDLDQRGMLWLPDGSGETAEEIHPGPREGNAPDGVSLLSYRIYHWVATS